MAQQGCAAVLQKCFPSLGLGTPVGLVDNAHARTHALMCACAHVGMFPIVFYAGMLGRQCTRTHVCMCACVHVRMFPIVLVACFSVTLLVSSDFFFLYVLYDTATAVCIVYIHLYFEVYTTAVCIIVYIYYRCTAVFS